jgi:hypothetical protein
VHASEQSSGSVALLLRAARLKSAGAPQSTDVWLVGEADGVSGWVDDDDDDDDDDAACPRRCLVCCRPSCCYAADESDYRCCLARDIYMVRL